MGNIENPMAHSKSKVSQTLLECEKCGNVQKIWRLSSKLKKNGHIKGLYCYRCEKITTHIEKSEYEKIY